MSWQLLGGAMVGTTIGWTVLWLRDRAGPALIEIAVSIATSDLGAMEARNLSLSLAVVVIDCGTGGLRRLSGPKDGRGAFLGRNANQRHGLLGRDKLARLIGVVLLGWSCPSRGAGWAWRLAILAGSDNGDRGPRSGAGRPMEWLSVVSTRLPPLRESLAGEGAAGQVAAAGAVAWASTRSVIRLIVVLSVPASWPDGQPFAERGLLLIVTAAVILGSALLQGLTLRRAVHGADFSGSGQAQREEGQARQAAANAKRQVGKEAAHPEGFTAKRRTLVGLRETNEIGDEALRRLLRGTDLRKRASEGDASPGTPPTNP